MTTQALPDPGSNSRDRHGNMVPLERPHGYTPIMAHDHAHTGHADPHSHGIWTHGHVFLGHGHDRSEARAKLAALVTAIFMVVEIGAGLMFRSMALLADGVHMATHVGALGLAAGAYLLARGGAAETPLSFGSGKFGDLAAFASAIVLGVIAAGVAVESVERLLMPVTVDYRNALIIAGVGLAVNVICAFILADSHDHDHGHNHARDHNIRAAYVHV